MGVLFRQGVSYGVVGAFLLLLDWALFVAASALGVTTVAANLLGRIGGALTGFWLNGVVTFRDHDGVRLGWHRLGRFALSWGLMSLLSSLALAAIDTHLGLHRAWLAKPFVDGLLALAGFFISRHWIYQQK